MASRNEAFFQLTVASIVIAETAPLIWLGLHWGWPWYAAWPAGLLAGSLLGLLTVGFWFLAMFRRSSRQAQSRAPDRPFPSERAP